MLKTGFSFRYAVGKPEDVVARLKTMGYSHAPIADVSSTYGWHKWRKACEVNGLVPVYGVSLYVTPSPSAKKPITDLWSFYAIDDIAPINDLVRLATSQFRYVPLLTYEQAMTAKNVIRVTGDRARLELMTPEENLFVGLSPSCAKGYIAQARERGFEFFATQNNRYINPEDKLFYEVVCGRDATQQTYPLHILSDEEWMSYCDNSSAIENRNRAFVTCTATIPKAHVLSPEHDKSLREMCVEGAKIKGVDLSDPIYAERLDLELKTIADKDFEDYFYIVADFMTWARREMAVGPARGSSAGSLVCYLLDITDVDPIEHGLLFFRFLDPNRQDWPDIDADFDATQRDRAIDYLISRYGIERVAKVGAVAQFQTKNSLDEVCRALGISRFDTKKVEDRVIEYAANDSRNDTALKEAFATTTEGDWLKKKYPGIEVAGEMGGSPRHASSHASGVLVSDKPLSNYVAVDSRSNTAQIEKDDAEKNGLLKLDILALKTLTLFDHCLKLVGKPFSFLRTVPLDDKAAFAVANDGKFLGTFQFDGYALQYLSKQMHIDNFNDLAILSALGRPGALDSGGADSWIRRRIGKEEVTYPHPLLEPYLKETLGILVYQETVMLIAHEVAGMNWNLVSGLRKAIAKSMGDEEIAKYKVPFVEGLKNNGIDESIAESFFNDILKFGKYSFNKSHSVAYGYMSYWSFYLKAHFPLEYAAAHLTIQTDSDKQLQVLRELAKEGVEYVAFDPELSTDKWTVNDGKLIGPIQNVIGIAGKTVNQIMSARARHEELPTKVVKKLQNAKTKLDSLTPVRSKMLEMGLASKSYYGQIIDIDKIELTGEWQRDIFICGLVTKVATRDENEQKRIEDRLARGDIGKKEGETRFLEIRVTDDTGTYFVKIGSKDYEKRGIKLTEVLEADKSYIVARGTIPPSAPVMLNDSIWIIKEKISEVKDN